MLKQKIEDQVLIQHLDGIPEDGRQVVLLADGQIRLTGLGGTTMVNQMRSNFRLGLLETYVLGQAYVASGLMASSVKGNDRIQLNVECGGPIGGIYVESWACGAVRGFLKNNPIPLDKPLEGKDISLLYGPGFISVTKLLEGSRTPFTGQTMMQYGDLAKDLALYYNESEQTPTMFSLGLDFDSEGRLMGAGGLFLQALPGCSDDVLERLQEKSSKLPPIGKAISSGKEVRDYIHENFAEFGVQDLATEPIGFSCPCTREHFKTFLGRLPQDERKGIIDDDKFPLELECLNCGTKYNFDKAEVRALFGLGKETT
ncbi:MAG: Hsp33 family molecular chaperone HslO [Spirochaetales bacterium]|nr:Hsp33 family molecular chaperone HslO [Spirochaetales bacterium]